MEDMFNPPLPKKVGHRSLNVKCAAGERYDEQCINIDFCKSHILVVALVDVPIPREELEYEYTPPCSGILKRDMFSVALLGVCRKECKEASSTPYLGAVYWQEPCPYCPKVNETVCNTHNIRYFNNAYLRGNGVCCECLDSLRIGNKDEVFVAVKR